MWFWLFCLSFDVIVRFFFDFVVFYLFRVSTLQKDKTRVFWGGQRSQHREQGNQIFFHVNESCASSSEPSSNETNEDFFYLCFRKKFLLYSVPSCQLETNTNFAVTFHALNQNHIFILESKARFWEKSRTKRNTLDLFISIIEWILAVFFVYFLFFIFFRGGGCVSTQILIFHDFAFQVPGALGAVDCTVDGDLCTEQGVKRYPTREFFTSRHIPVTRVFETVPNVISSSPALTNSRIYVHRPNTLF